MACFFCGCVSAQPSCHLYCKVTNNLSNTIRETCLYGLCECFQRTWLLLSSSYQQSCCLCSGPAREFFGGEYGCFYLRIEQLTPSFTPFKGEKLFMGLIGVCKPSRLKCSRRASLSIFPFSCLLPSSNTQAFIIICHIK